MEQEENLCNEVEILRWFAYLGNRVRIGGGWEAAWTARTQGVLRLKNVVSYCNERCFF